MSDLDLTAFRQAIETELIGNILSFWMKHSPDDNFGGFRGRISNRLVAEPEAEKGIILNTRILWTFSRAFSAYGEQEFLRMARRAYEYIDQCFLDREFGGVYWTVDYRGRPLDTRKKTYAQGFAIYALSEYFMATRERSACDRASEIFNLVESNARDQVNGGYLETFDRDWTLSAEQRLSSVDQDDRKSMNTHLHVLEAYTNLSTADGNQRVKNATRDTLMLFAEEIVDTESFHSRLFFDEDWHVKSSRISFGHDIEASWLLCEAARAIGEPDLLAKASDLSARMASAVYAEGIDCDGALLYEADPSGVINYDKHWWPQAEAVVGFLNSYQLTMEERFLIASVRCWEFIQRSIIDKAHGEWFWKVSRNGLPDVTKPKVDQWKCPYHNGRMCFEAMSRLDSIEGRA